MNTRGRAQVDHRGLRCVSQPGKCRMSCHSQPLDIYIQHCLNLFRRLVRKITGRQHACVIYEDIKPAIALGCELTQGTHD